MELLQAVAIVAAGIAAGAINAVVGSGTLVTFPTLVALGYPPVVANVSNTVGLFPGSFAAAWGYRRELVGQGRRLVILGSASALGGMTGAVLLLVLPPEAFQAIVPVLILLACGLVLAQPWITRRLSARPPAERPAHGSVVLVLAVFGTGVYGGYFGAAQGVLLIAVLVLGTGDAIQRANGAKNFLVGVVNLVAAIFFVIVADVDWAVAGLIAVGSLVGGLGGAVVGRRIPPMALRLTIVVIGLTAVVLMVV